MIEIKPLPFTYAIAMVLACLLGAWNMCAAEPLESDARIQRPRVILSEAAKEIHNSGFVFDGHNDLPWQIRNKASSTFAKMDIAKHLK